MEQNDRRCKILNLRLGVNKEGTMENNQIELILPLRLFSFVYRIKDSSFKGKTNVTTSQHSGGERGLVVRALDLQAGGPGFKSSFLPLDGFVFGGPELNSCTLCKQPTGSPPTSWDSYHAHLNIFTWNLRDINVYYFIYLFYLFSTQNRSYTNITTLIELLNFQINIDVIQDFSGFVSLHCDWSRQISWYFLA